MITNLFLYILRFLVKSIKAFSLIEVCISLTLISIVSVSTLSLLKISSKAYKRNITKDHFTHIIHAVSSYVLANNCLPAPADFDGISRNFSDTKFGGFVPYKTLGLPRVFSMDGSGKAILYFAPPELSDKAMLKEINREIESNPNRIFCEVMPYNQITIKNEKDALDKNPVAVLLISSNKEFDNTMFSFDFMSDDIFMWVSRSQLMSYYAKMTCKAYVSKNKA